MRKYLLILGLFVAVTAGFAFTLVESPATDITEAVKKKENKVVQMNLELFKNQVFDYETQKEWNFKGNKPAIIDLYADWCGPCRMIAPILKDLALEYDGKVDFYKVNVDKERELAQLFNVTSIPLLVFIPKNGIPKLAPGAQDKAAYKKMIDEFLLENK